MSNYSLSNFRSLTANTVDELKKLSFSSEDVLVRSEDLRVRQTNLEKAVALGGSDFLRTALILKTIDGNLYKLEAKVIGLDANKIKTDKGLFIPLVCIYSVDFY